MAASIIWDIALALLAVLVIVVCTVKGMLTSLVSLLGTAASVVVAAVFAPKAAGWIYDSFLAEQLEQSISEGMAERLTAFAELIHRLGLGDTITNATESAVRTVAVAFITVIAFLIIFLLALLIVRLLLLATKGVNKVPVLGSINHVFGGVLGAAEAYLLLYVVSMLVTFLVSLSKNQWSWLNAEVVEGSKLLTWFIQHKLPF